MKVSKGFEGQISAHLEGLGAKDPLFAETLKKPGKNMKDCITYILNKAKAGGANGYTDGEVFGWAVHYYDEDNIDIGKPISAMVTGGPAKKEKATTEVKPAPPAPKVKPKKESQTIDLFDGL